MKKNFLPNITFILFSFFISFTSFANEAPTIGGGAEINAVIKDGGVINAGAGGGEGNSSVTTQNICSMQEGEIDGNLNLNCEVDEGGIVNASGTAGEGVSSVVTQDVGAAVGDVKVSGNLELNVKVEEGGILNAGGNAGAGNTSTVCQSIGTVGSSCEEANSTLP